MVCGLKLKNLVHYSSESPLSPQSENSGNANICDESIIYSNKGLDRTYKM